MDKYIFILTIFIATVSISVASLSLVSANHQVLHAIPANLIAISSQEMLTPTVFAISNNNTSLEKGQDVTVSQEPGKTVYWVLPGPAKLDEQVFGTPEFPMNTGEYKISKAEGPVKELFEKFPIMAGVPMAIRETNNNGTEFTHTTIPTPVSDRASIVDGSFEVTYNDRQPYDLPAADTIKTTDKVSMNVNFTDPVGNQYELKLKKLYQPPFPGFESGGGVITDAWVHGNTGIDSPLFPTIFTYGAFWGVGDIIVNGTIVDKDKWIHFMTTQNVRDLNYHLVTSEGLPLMPEETFSGQTHHTHVIVRPIKITSEGPIFDPVKTEYTLLNGMKQPFIHVMFEEDKILNSKFKDWTPEITKSKNQTSEISVNNPIVIEADEFSFNPNQLKAM